MTRGISHKCRSSHFGKSSLDGTSPKSWRNIGYLNLDSKFTLDSSEQLVAPSFTKILLINEIRSQESDYSQLSVRFALLDDPCRLIVAQESNESLALVVLLSTQRQFVNIFRIILVKPATVKIVLSESQIFAGRPIIARCETWGSSPAARIVWRLGEQVIGDPNVSTTQRSNTTVSKLVLVLSKEDDEKELVCRAENPRFPGGSLEEVKPLRVLCEFPLFFSSSSLFLSLS